MNKIQQHYQYWSLVGLLSIFMIGNISLSQAQDKDKSKKKTFKEWKEGVKGKFNDWKTEHPISFKRHKAKNDSLFLGFLKKDWKDIHLFQGLKRDGRKKPKAIPQYSKDVSSKQEIQIYQDGKTTRIKNLHPILHTYDTFPTYPESKHPSFTVYYLGKEITARLDPALSIPMNNFSQANVADYWAAMSKTDYEVFISDLFTHRKKLGLNDWSHHQIVWEFSKQLYPNDLNQQSLFVWYMLLQSGYQAKIGLGANQAFLLVATQQQVFNKVHYNLDGTLYYLLSRTKVKRIRTYQESFSKKNVPLDLALHQGMPWLEGEKSRNVHFDYAGQSYSFHFKYNPYYIDYFNTVPTIGVEWHFSANPSPTVKQSIVKELQPIVSKMSKTEGANFLLAMIQKGFPYQTDAEQFGAGVEKYFYVEEIFHYPYSDCEDRSILYAFLVKELLHLDVVGLDYPGHIATSVRFDEEVSGDFIEFDGQKYIVCDPTYINAPIGRSLPQVSGYSAKVIPYIDELEGVSKQN